MFRFAATRLFSLSLSLIAASIVVFAVTSVVPGDPATFMLGMNAKPETVAALRQELGLNVGIWAQYYGWITGMLVGDFGISYTYRVPVSELIAQRIWVSLPLAMIALVLSIIIAFPVGLIAASNRGKFSDYSIMGATQLGIAVPNFWFAMLLLWCFRLTLDGSARGAFRAGKTGCFRV